MLTLEETLASQSGLGRLCADRALETNEIFAANAFYGIDLILKRYAGLPPAYQLKVVVPHGLVLSEAHIWEEESKAPLPVVLCYPSYRERLYISSTDKVVIPAASPFLYALELLRGQNQRVRARKGTIFFPAHSTHHVTAQMDFERLAEGLAHVPPEYQPITVCMYWRDFNLGHHVPFQKRGMRIVSAGHIYDSDFLFRFHHLCSIHRYSGSNSLGSAMFYSVKSGCSFFYLDRVEYSSIADDHVLRRDTAEVSPARKSQLKSLFCRPQPSMTEEQLRTVDYYLGANYLKSARALRQELLCAERLDKFGFVVHNHMGRARFAIPPFYQRMARAALIQGGHWIRRGLRRLRRVTAVSATDVEHDGRCR